VAVKSEEISEMIWSRIKDYIFDVQIETNNEHRQRVGRSFRYEGNWAPHGLNEVWRLCRYQPGGHFAPHFDGFFVRNFNERSMKTFMLYLNGADEDETGFEGGTTNFVDDNQSLFKDDSGIFRAQEENIYSKIKPVAGLAIVFNHRILHEGEQVRSGRKYIMRSDIMYRRIGDPLKLEPREEQAVLLLQQAEFLETDGKPTEAAELYRKAFKMWPPLEDSVSYLSGL